MFLQKTWLQHHLAPLLFLNSLHVLSCWRQSWVVLRFCPCFFRIVIHLLKSSHDMLPSFFVLGSPMVNRTNLPWQIADETCSLIRWKFPKSFPRIAACRGSANFSWSMPSAIMQTQLPLSRDAALFSQYKILSIYWDFKCACSISIWRHLAFIWEPKAFIMALCRIHVVQAVCCVSVRNCRQANSVIQTLLLANVLKNRQKRNLPRTQNSWTRFFILQTKGAGSGLYWQMFWITVKLKEPS